MKKFAFYGTLRLNQPNYHRLLTPKTAEFLGTKIVGGYAMYDLGYYPTIVEHNDGQITVDLFEISDKRAIEFIKSMELGAGYKEVTITIDGTDYTMYVCGDSELPFIVNRRKPIPSGDWVDHISEKTVNAKI